VPGTWPSASVLPPVFQRPRHPRPRPLTNPRFGGPFRREFVGNWTSVAADPPLDFSLFMEAYFNADEKAECSQLEDPNPCAQTYDCKTFQTIDSGPAGWVIIESIGYIYSVCDAPAFFLFALPLQGTVPYPPLLAELTKPASLLHAPDIL
jgi:hypothetical protein